MKTTLIRAAAAALALGVAAPAPAAEVGKLVTVVTSAEPQTQLMAMILTMQAVQKGVGARVLLCGPAGDLGLAAPPAAATAPQPPRGMSPQGLMAEMMKAGAVVEVCAVYLPGKGLSPDALLPGVTVGQPPDVAGAMLATDARIWSF